MAFVKTPFEKKRIHDILACEKYTQAAINHLQDKTLPEWEKNSKNPISEVHEQYVLMYDVPGTDEIK